jgi:glycosyltransferase involved in cell wall biosynthesis
MRILLVTTRYPWPPRRGLELRTLQFASWLSRRHEVTVLAPAPGIAARATPEPGFAVELYEPSRAAAAVGVVRAIPEGWPLQAGIYAQPGLARAIARLLPRCDLAIAQLVRLAPHLHTLRAKPLVVDFIDSMGLHFARRAELDRPERRWFWRLEARRLDRCERILAERAAVSWLVSDRDRAHLARRLSPSAAERLHTLPLAVEARTRPREPDGDPVVVITGNLGYHPTVEGLVWWLREVWPGLRRRQPSARLVLAGSRPAGSVRRAARQPGVELQEEPDDLFPLLEKATVAVAPARGGAGVPIKVLEAWAAGVPVVAHPWSAAGAGAVAGEDLLSAETVSQWIEALGALIESPARRAQLRESAWRRLGAEFSAEVLAGRLLTQVADVEAAIRRREK